MTEPVLLEVLQVLLGVLLLVLALVLCRLVGALRRLHSHRMEAAVGKLVREVRGLRDMEVVSMNVGQEVLEAVQAQTTLVGSVMEFITGLKDEAVSPEAKQAILLALQENNAALEAAMAANVEPPTP